MTWSAVIVILCVLGVTGAGVSLAIAAYIVALDRLGPGPALVLAGLGVAGLLSAVL